MPEPGRRRRRWIALAVAVALLGVGALIVRHLLRPEAMTAMLVGNARSQLGAELALSESGRFGFVPDLHLVLANPSLKQTPQGIAFLSAKSADVVMPWSVLWSDRYDIQRIELVKPRLDLDALNAWIASRPDAGASPDIRFALRATDATVTAGDKTIAEHVDLDFASSGDVVGWLTHQRESAKAATLLPPLSGTIQAAKVDVGDTHLEGVRIESREDDAATKPAPGKLPR
jgi:hypothetical protein